MYLLWKLLRQHISISQFCGFFLANLIGMTIVLAGYQFYNDVLPIFTSEDSFMKSDYLVVTKQIGTATTLSGRSNTFNAKDIQSIQEQPFVKKLGAFTSTNYKINGLMSIEGKNILNSEIFFESVPDEFIDVNTRDWHYTPGDTTVPIILPRTYINMYNFGFAQTHSLPQISEGVMGMIDLRLLLRGNSKQQEFKGRIVAFSNSISTILVPQSFMEWSNHEFAPNEEPTSTRLLIEVTNPADEKITEYLDENGLEIDKDQLDMEKTAYFLRITVSLVMTIGIIISTLSFYILMLSIYLLVEKNTKKLQNLLLIGYPTSRVALPYQSLTCILNFLVLIMAIAMVVLSRSYYMNIINSLYPDTSNGTLLYSIALGGILFMIVTTINIVTIRKKIKSL